MMTTPGSVMALLLGATCAASWAGVARQAGGGGRRRGGGRGAAAEDGHALGNRAIAAIQRDGRDFLPRERERGALVARALEAEVGHVRAGVRRGLGPGAGADDRQAVVVGNQVVDVAAE